MYNIAHIIASKLYMYFCIPDTFSPINHIIMAPFTIMSPHCLILRWSMTDTANSIYFQILMLGAWIVDPITQYNNDNNGQ